MIITIVNEDQYILGYIKTNCDLETIEAIRDHSIETEPDNHNYDVNALINDIENNGFTADRVYLETLELY